MAKKVIVIGSGFGGLGAAARLAALGYDVELFEKRDKPGGRAYVYEIDGFKFDGGPTVITAPFMFDDIFEFAGRRREDYVQFVSCDPFYRIFDHHGKYFDYNGETDFVLDQIDRWNPADKQGYLNFVEGIKDIFHTGMALIDQPCLPSTSHRPRGSSPAPAPRGLPWARWAAAVTCAVALAAFLVWWVTGA